MGASSLSASPVSPSSLSLHSPLDDWFPADHFSAAPLPYNGLSSSNGSPSSSSCSSDRPQGRSFLQGNDLDGSLYLRPNCAFSQTGNPIISSTSALKEKPVSPLNSNNGCVSALTTYFMPNSKATEPLQAFHGGLNHLANPIVKPLEENTSSCISSISTSTSASASPSSVALSSPACSGAAGTKVSKRRARINKKVPIAMLSADASNFRAMVQQLTGIPSTHAPPPMWGSSVPPLLRPQPTRFAFNGGLRTLDTSVPFLGARPILPLLQRAQQPSMNGLFASGGGSNSAELSSRSNMSSCTTSTQGLWDALGSDAPPPDLQQMKGSMKELSAENVVKECEQSFPRQSTSLLESLFMLDEDVFAKSSLNPMDSWLASDGGALLSLSPRVDIAKIAS